MKRSSHLILIAVLVAVLALVAACSGGAEAPKDNPQPAATVQPASSGANPTTPAEQKPAEQKQSTSAPTAAAKAPKPVEEKDATEAKDLARITNIKSYRSISGMDVDGKTAGGEPFKSGMEVLTEVTLDPPAEHTKTNLTGAGADDPMAAALFGERYQVGDEVYYQQQGEWKKFTVSADTKDDESDSDLSAASPEEVNEMIKVAKRVGRETVNGRSTTHYRIDKAGLIALDEADKKRAAEEAAQNEDEEGNSEEEEDWYDEEEEDDEGLTDFAKAGDAYADIWLDNQEGFIVKYVMTLKGDNIEGTAGPDGQPISGTFTFFSEYKDVNANFTITVPDEVKKAATE